MNLPPSLLDIPSVDLHPMTEGQSRVFLMTTLLEMSENADELSELLKQTYEQTQQGTVIVDRLQKFGVYDKVTPGVIIFIASIARSFGEITLWVYTLHKATEKRKEPLNMSALSELFGLGFPSEEQAMQIWDAQKKVGNPLGNALDTPETYGLKELQPSKPL